MLQYYLHHVNNSHQKVEFAISIISNLVLSCWYDDGVDWKRKLMKNHRTH